MTDKEKIANLMENLQCDEKTALEIIAYDKAVDKGEKTKYDLSPEQEKFAKKYANVREHKKPTNYQLTKRERKANPTKASIITEIAEFLTENSENACENVKITNKERQIAFKIGENSYELTLVQKRKPKN